MRHETQDALIRLIDRFSKVDGINETPLPGVHAIRLYAPEASLPSVYEASLCVIVQGRKEVLLSEDSLTYGPSQFLAVSVDLPVIGRVTEASSDAPYLCLQIALNQARLSEMLGQIGAEAARTGTPGRGICVGTLDDQLADCVLRLARLMDSPRDIAVLAPIITSELHYRLLTHPVGPDVAQLVIQDSALARIAAVLRRIRAEYQKPIRVEQLARQAGMSLSSFHAHFKAVTDMSPLQFQKRLRLMEARRLMIGASHDAAGAAFEVGYESASQFSREYSRLFGNPPGRDVAQLMQRAQA